MNRVKQYFGDVEIIKKKLDMGELDSLKIIMREDGSVTIYDYYELNWHIRKGFDTMSEYISWLEE